MPVSIRIGCDLRVVTGDLLDKETINIKFQKVSNRVIFETKFLYFCEKCTILFVTVGNKGVEEVSDLDISTLVDLSSDVIHLSSYLLKVEQCVGIFDKGIVGVVFNSKICKVDHGGVGGSSDSLFHGFRVVAEMTAKLGKRSVGNSITVSDHIVDDINNIFASDFSDDSQFLQDILCFLRYENSWHLHFARFLVD